jgi:hypothetical protein
MLEVSRFYGIVITINHDDYLPPHFHAAGWLPRRALTLVRLWAGQHQAELAFDWARAGRLEPLLPIPPWTRMA